MAGDDIVMAVSRWQSVLAWCLTAAFVASCGIVSAGEVTISAERVARVFYAGEPISLCVTADCSRQKASFEVYDYFEMHWYSGEVTIGAGQTTVVEIPRKLPFGWYGFRISVDGAMVEDAFCVIPQPYTYTRGDDALFHMQLSTYDERHYAAAAQLGIRCLRTDLSWPDIEQDAGQYSFELFRGKLQLCRKYGMRLMATVGYTPGWNAVQPQNGPDDWIREASFVWHPRSVERWQGLVEQAVAEARTTTVEWPSREILRDEAYASPQTAPVVHSWEVWNEADHAFYMGSWGRYLDLLRITYCTVKETFPDSRVIYGGASGNWQTMGITCANHHQLYFDRLAFHPNTTVDDVFIRWYRGIYQLPWVDGFPRETCANEGYCVYGGDDMGFATHQQEPGDLFRVRTEMMFWNQDTYFRSSCAGQWVARPGESGSQNALMLEKNGGLVPTPLYAGFAAARHWLTNATYVGPVSIGEKTEAHMLLKLGRPLLIAWSDEGERVIVKRDEVAERITVMGRRIDLRRGRTSTHKLERAPLIIWGADPVYLQEALKNRYELFAHTALGNYAGDVWYFGVGELMDDAKNWIPAGFEAAMQQGIDRAAEMLGCGGVEGPAAVEDAMAVCQYGMLRVTAKCMADGGVPPRAIGTMYRLAYIIEWLGLIADDRALMWSEGYAAPGEIARYRNRIRIIAAQLSEAEPRGDPPFIETLLERAGEQLRQAAELNGRGSLRAAKAETFTAEHLMGVEQPVVRRLFSVADFGTAVQLRKTHLLEPEKEHTVAVTMHNYLSTPASGTIHLSIPETWEAVSPLEHCFEVGGHEVSEAVMFRFQIPGGPLPWQHLTPNSPDSVISIDVPQGLQPISEVIVRAELDDGTALLRTLYQVYVGKLNDSAEFATASVSPGLHTFEPPAERTAAVLGQLQRWLLPE
jgi:hypothetical protein